MIGRCYVHLGQYHRALRKFDEMETQFPDSPLILQARIWRARALLELDRRKSCVSELAGIEIESLDRESKIDALHVWADLHKREEAGERLAEVQAQLLKLSPRRRKAAWHLELGRTFLQLDRREEAVEHFRATRRRSTPRAILLQGRIAEIDSRIHLGDLDRAADLIQSLEKDERFFEDLDQAVFQKGHLEHAKENFDRASGYWHQVLADYPRTESASASACSIGRLFLRHKVNTDSARVYFKQTRQESASSVWADSANIELGLLEQVEEIYTQIDLLDSLCVGLEKQMIPDTLRLRHASSLLPQLRLALQAEEDSLLALDSLHVQTPDSLTQASRPNPEGTNVSPRSSVPTPAGTRHLFKFKKAEREQARLDSLVQVAHDDSTRFILTQRLQQEEDSILMIGILDTLTFEAEIDSVWLLDQIDSLASCRFDERFRLAEMQVYKLDQPKRADSLMVTLTVDPAASREQAARLLFAHGLLKERQLENETSETLFRRVVKRYPMASAANPARARLGLEQSPSASDSAKVLLSEAEEQWFQRQPTKALEIYDTLISRYPLTPEVYTALVAKGLIYWDDLGLRDNAMAQFERALRRFPDGAAETQLRALLGREIDLVEVMDEPAPEDEIAVSEAITDLSGRFVLPENPGSLEERLAALRERFKTIGRLSLDHILDGGIDRDETEQPDSPY
jgi:tetratricopeptide (TPR) repeat protein